ncbi:MAG: SGNH/GDSL hydrolase family protein [Phycisphaerae bacterium]
MSDKTHRTLLVVGDSISLGIAEIRGTDVTGRVQRSYLDILHAQMPEINFIVDADIHRTTADAVELIDALLQKHQTSAVLVMLGGNDVDLLWKRFVISNGKIVQNRIRVDRYAANLTGIAQKIIAAGSLPILTDMPNHSLDIRGRYLSQLSGKDVSAMIQAHGGQPVSDRELEVYRVAAAKVAQELGCPFVRYGTALSHLPLESVSGPDGVHPNDHAHEIIAQELFPVIESVMDKCRTAEIGSKL